MKLTSDQIRSLVQLIGMTKDEECNCNECLEHIGEFAERELRGEDVSEALLAVKHHLSICPECREEYEALLRALSSLE